VQDFARSIEEKTELAGDDAIYLACEFVELVKSRILERGETHPRKHGPDSSRTWVAV
jgi:hypothetical protein